MFDLAHLAFYEEGPTDGAVQRDEALLLHALVRVTRPRTVVELGFFRGDSAFNFLRALDAEARLYSFDIDPACAETARERFGHDRRFTFHTRSQDELAPDDLDGRRADLVFIDAAHDLTLNQATFERLLPLLAPRAIVAIHDTGGIPRDLLALADGHWMLALPEIWADDEWEHQPGERAFTNWLLDRHAEFSQIHLHSRHTMRAGLTLLQRTAPLPRPPGAD
jgi:trans-aconitate methyltransferase